MDVSLHNEEVLHWMLYELSNDNNEAVKKINSLLNEKSSRLKGLKLLEELLPSFPDSIIFDNVLQWLRQCGNALGSIDHQNTELMNIACRTIVLLLEEAANHPECARFVSGGVLAQVFPVLTKALSLHCVPAIECLIGFLKLFGESCGTYQKDLKAALIELMQGECEESVQRPVAECWACLPQTGGSGKKGVNHAEAWNKYCLDIITTAHSILDKLFFGITEYTDKTTKGVNIFRPDHKEEIIPRMSTLISQYSNIVKCLQALLCSDYSVTVTIPINDVLELSFRVLGMTGERMCVRSNVQKRMLLANYSILHVQALVIIKALILSCKQNLMPYCENIVGIIADTLKSMVNKDPVSGKKLKIQDVKIEAYSTLKLWLEVCGCCLYPTDRFDVMSFLITHLLTELKYYEGKVNISAFAKKRKRKLSLRKQNSECVSEALSLLTTILKTNVLFLTPQQVKQIQETAFNSLADMQCKSSSLPYIGELEALFNSFLLYPHPGCAAPLQYTSTLLNNNAISTCIRHPRGASLDLPVLTESVEQSEEKLNKQFMDCGIQTDKVEEPSSTNQILESKIEIDEFKDDDKRTQNEKSSELINSANEEMRKESEEEGECRKRILDELEGGEKKKKKRKQKNHITTPEKINGEITNASTKPLETNTTHEASTELCEATKKTEGSEYLAEMLATFVDAEPDND